MGGDRNVRSDLIFSHPSVVGLLYVEDSILQKAFLPTKISNFSDRLKTSVVAVCGSCSSSTPIKINHRNLFSDAYRFSSGGYHDLFLSVEVGDFLQEAYRVNPDYYPALPDRLEFANCNITSVLWCLPLSAGAQITEGPVSDEGVIELLTRHHPVAGEWGVLMGEDHIVSPPFLDARQSCPIPVVGSSIIHLQEPRLPVIPLFRHLAHPSMEIIAANEKKLRLTNPPSIIEVGNVIGGNVIGVVDSVKSTSSTSTVTTEVNKRMSIFKSILFSLPVDDDNGTVIHLAPASLTDEVREIFVSASSTSEQARLISDAFFSLANDISLENHYLSRLCRFPMLSHTLVIFMLQSHYHVGNMDCNMDSLKKYFSILTLLAPPVNDDEFLLLQNSSKNVGLEEMLHQPSEKRSSVSKTVFVKGRQDSLDDVIALLANIMVLGRFWVKFMGTDESTYPYVLRQLVGLVDVLTSAKFR